MVRHGRLSKGCLTCRKRKVKCDEARPGCNQCLKSGWACPQYTDSVERMFQNQDTIGNLRPLEIKAPKTSKRPLTRVLCQILPSETIPPANNTINPTVPSQILARTSIPKEILPSIDNHTIDFFCSNFTFSDSPGPIRGYYEYLPSIRNSLKTDETFTTALSAVATAAYACVFRYPNLLLEARRRFGRAIRLINNAVASSREVKKDSTLISILLLNTFSTISSKTLQSLHHCHVHISGGAISVIKLRGHHQFESRRALQSFLQICYIVFHGCLHRSVRFPEELTDLRAASEKFVDTSYPAWKVHDVMTKYAAFRADVKDGVLCGYESVVEEATKLDVEFINLEENMPVEWQYKTVLTSKSSKFVFGTCYHIYPDLWIASIWNDIRVCRILLHEEIQTQSINILRLNPSSLPDTWMTIISNKLSTTHQTIQALINEICATVPQYCSNSSMPRHSSHENAVDISDLPQEFQTPDLNAAGYVPPAAGVVFLLWQLLTAGLLVDSDIQREYIIRSARYLGWSTGIQQAFTLANVLEGNENSDDWWFD